MSTSSSNSDTTSLISAPASQTVDSTLTSPESATTTSISVSISQIEATSISEPVTFSSISVSASETAGSTSTASNPITAASSSFFSVPQTIESSSTFESSVASSSPISTALPSSGSGSTSNSQQLTTLSSISGTSTLIPSSVTSVTVAPSSVPSIGTFKFAGCYTEATKGRALSEKSQSNEHMTIEICASFCQGYAMFGLEYGKECYCGNKLNAGSISAPESSCSLACKANTLQYCGGFSRLSLYSNVNGGPELSSSNAISSTIGQIRTSTTTIPVILRPTSTTTFNSLTTLNTLSTSTTSHSKPTTTPLTQGFTPLGCFSDPAGGPFTGHNMPKLFSNDSMTPSLCISSALARLSATPATTYAYVALEYGRECYAHTAAPSPQPTNLMGSKACTFPCKGNLDGEKEKCGAGNMYNLWVATSVGEVAWTKTGGVSTTGTSTGI
ncbi:hypothetical protein HYFRA_00002553 [Hymenoscyphus fraxineus]|uniref:WSC domain-containing protein n=1 Tax=Hymenoscyphus fraxineus TaxID=746836 RepID=A0A9N9PZG3_9HELO|nr:hypothetical protein HYFRA_00002553 [Hymenoscyphus fraxineus]